MAFWRLEIAKCYLDAVSLSIRARIAQEASLHGHVTVFSKTSTIKGGSRRAEKSRKVLMMMMKAVKLGWAGPGAGHEQGWSKVRAGLKHDQGRSRAGTGTEQS